MNQMRSVADAVEAADALDQPSDVGLAMLRQPGIAGLVIPPEYGGSGCDRVTCNQRIAEVARCDASLAIILYQHYSVALRLLEHGSAQLKGRYLPRLANGEMIAASAWSESGAGANKQSLQTTAVPISSARWMLNGKKSFTTGAGVANLYLVLTKTSHEAVDDSQYGAAGQTFFLVEANSEGLRCSTNVNMSGMRASSTGFLELHECLVPACNILGEVGAARQVIAGVRHCGMTLGAVSLGIAEAAVEIARGAVDRLSVGSRQYHIASNRLSRLAVDLAATRALVEATGRRESPNTGVDCLAAKIFASESSERICRETQQLVGGRSIVRGTPIERLVRDARGIALMGPVNDLALDLVWEELKR